MLSPQRRMRVIEVRKIARTAIDRAHRHADSARIDPVEIAERLERGLQRRGVVVADQLRRPGCGGQWRRETRDEKAFLPLENRPEGLRCRKRLAQDFTGVEKSVFEESGQRWPERR